MRAIIEEGDTDWSRTMQEMSLNESALPRHLVTALFSKQTDRNLLAQRHLSRQLVSLFLTDNPDGIALMQRIIVSLFIVRNDHIFKLAQGVRKAYIVLIPTVLFKLYLSLTLCYYQLMKRFMWFT